MQAAKRLDAGHLIHGLQEAPDVLFVDAVLVSRKRQQGLAALFHAQVVGVLVAGAVQQAVDRIDHAFGQLAAQLDVNAAPGHVGGDGDGPKGARPGDDLRFFGVLAGVQHLVRDAAFQVGLQARDIRLAQVQDGQQVRQVAGIFGIGRDFQVAGHLAQIGRQQRIQWHVERLQLGDQAAIFFALVLFQPGVAQHQHLGQLAQRLGPQAAGEVV